MLNNPVLSVYIKQKNETEYMENKEYYAGTFDRTDDIQIDMMIWNNRGGKEDAPELKHFNVSMEFEDIEDTTLFNYCKCIVNNTSIVSPAIVGNTAVVQFPDNIVLYGTANDGSLLNSDNYTTFSLIFTLPKDKNVKMNDLKSLTLSISKI